MFTLSKRKTSQPGQVILTALKDNKPDKIGNGYVQQQMPEDFADWLISLASKQDAQSGTAIVEDRPMTLDEVISALQDVREKSNLKGEAVVHICIQECPYIPVIRVSADNDPSGGCCILVHPEFEP